jgi:hypothetical protein
MTAKKTFGYIFTILSMLLALAILGQLPALFKALSGIFGIINGNNDAYKTGIIIGSCIYWVIHFILTVILWMYGSKWRKWPDVTGKQQ